MPDLEAHSVSAYLTKLNNQDLVQRFPLSQHMSKSKYKFPFSKEAWTLYLINLYFPSHMSIKMIGKHVGSLTIR